MSDCLTCKHNSYLDRGINGWISCVHPVTIKKVPRWERGDPAMVDYRTGDVRIRDLGDIPECPTWQSAAENNTKDAAR
jgi:hypothetical protein